MQFDLSNRNLAQKISILVLGITLFASVAIGGVGEMVLHKVTDSHAKQAASVASLDRLVGQGERRCRQSAPRTAASSACW